MEQLKSILPTHCPPSFTDDPEFQESLSSPEKARAWLDAHLNDGIGHLNEKDGIDCPICHNTGFLYRRDEYTGEEFARECECQKERKKVRADRASGAPIDTKSKTFDTYETKESWQRGLKQSAMQFTQGCVGGSHDWFFIGGQPGIGKTHLAKAIRNVVIGADKKVRWMTWKDDAAQLKAMLNSDGYKPLCDTYKKAEILFIDDFIKTRREGRDIYRMPTDGDVNLAFEIIKYRDENDLVTIITSEFTIDAIYGFDQSIGGRIKQRCGAYCFGVAQDAGKDYRI